MKRDNEIDFFTYINLKYGQEKEKKDLLDKMNDFGEKIFVGVGNISEKISDRIFLLFKKSINDK